MDEFDDIEDMADFARFAAQQPEVWSDGLCEGEPTYSLDDPDEDDTGVEILCNRAGWLAIIARYNAAKANGN